MPIFAPGQAKTPSIPVRISPAGLSCELELFLGPSVAEVAATTGRRPFTSTGELQTVSASLAMPASPGSYHTYIDVAVSGQILGRYIAADVSIGNPAVVITLGSRKNPTFGLWAIQAFDPGTQTMLRTPLSPVDTPFRLEIVSSQVLLWVTESSGMTTFLYGPYLVTIPDLNSSYAWDSPAGALNGIPQPNLPYIANASRITGQVKQIGVGSGGLNSVLDVVVESSVPTSFEGEDEVLHEGADHAQYLRGAEIRIGNAIIPLGESGGPLIALGDRITFDAYVKPPSTIPLEYSAKWYGRNFVKARAYPDAWYAYHGSLAKAQVGGAYPNAIYDITWSISGGAAPCRVAIVLWNAFGNTGNIDHLYGPGTGTFRANSGFQPGYTYSGFYELFAHPDTAAVWDRWSWRVKNWVYLGRVS